MRQSVFQSQTPSPLSPSRARQALFVNGFTLVELLIVCGIITILLLLTLPLAQAMTRNARKTKCTSNLRQIGAALQLYRGEHNNTFPPANASTLEIQAETGWIGLWYTPTKPSSTSFVAYLGDNQDAVHHLVVCPENLYRDIEPPPIKSPYGFPYSVNYNVMVSAGALKSKNALTLESPSRVVVMVDAATGQTPGTKWGLGANSVTSGWAAWENRHRGEMNILWADGRVTSGRKEQEITNSNF